MTDWRKDLSGFLGKGDRDRQQEPVSELARFIADVVLPAFAEIREQLEQHGREVTIRHTDSAAALIVSRGGDEEMNYRIQGRTFPNAVLPYSEIRFRERKGLRMIRKESMIRSGPPDYRLADVTREEVIRNFVAHYTRHVEQ